MSDSEISDIEVEFDEVEFDYDSESSNSDTGNDVVVSNDVAPIHRRDIDIRVLNRLGGPNFGAPDDILKLLTRLKIHLVHGNYAEFEKIGVIIRDGSAENNRLLRNAIFNEYFIEDSLFFIALHKCPKALHWFHENQYMTPTILHHFSFGDTLPKIICSGTDDVLKILGDLGYFHEDSGNYNFYPVRESMINCDFNVLSNICKFCPEIPDIQFCFKHSDTVASTGEYYTASMALPPVPLSSGISIHFSKYFNITHATINFRGCSSIILSMFGNLLFATDEYHWDSVEVKLLLNMLYLIYQRGAKIHFGYVEKNLVPGCNLNNLQFTTQWFPVTHTETQTTHLQFFNTPRPLFDSALNVVKKSISMACGKENLHDKIKGLKLVKYTKDSQTVMPPVLLNQICM